MADKGWKTSFHWKWVIFRVQLLIIIGMISYWQAYFFPHKPIQMFFKQYFTTDWMILAFTNLKCCEFGRFLIHKLLWYKFTHCIGSPCQVKKDVHFKMVSVLPSGWKTHHFKIIYHYLPYDLRVFLVTRPFPVHLSSSFTIDHHLPSFTW